MGSPRNPPVSEDMVLELGPRKFPMLSMRAKWAILILATWTFMGISYLTAYDEITSTLHFLKQGTSLNGSQDTTIEGQGRIENPMATILRDDFDDPEFYSLWEKGEAGTGTVTFRDGYAFLNTTNRTGGEEDADAKTGVTLWHKNRHPYRYAGVEIRLRCSDDNRIESGIGGGWRLWGFWDLHATQALYFSCASPESPPDKVGLQAHSTVGNIEKLWEPITGIDIREWHTYTILWAPSNATFLVDGEVVATTDQAPLYNMDVAVANFHKVLALDSSSSSSCMNVPYNQSIQIDYIHVFNITEPNLQDYHYRAG